MFVFIGDGILRVYFGQILIDNIVKIKQAGLESQVVDKVVTCLELLLCL